MNCGPSVAVERRDGAVLRCPRCGDEQQVPDLPMFVVTGASGTGKSTVTQQEPPLRRPSEAINITARIERGQVLGGLISDYRRAA